MVSSKTFQLSTEIIIGVVRTDGIHYTTTNICYSLLKIIVLSLIEETWENCCLACITYKTSVDKEEKAKSSFSTTLLSVFKVSQRFRFFQQRSWVCLKSRNAFVFFFFFIFHLQGQYHKKSLSDTPILRILSFKTSPSPSLLWSLHLPPPQISPRAPPLTLEFKLVYPEGKTSLGSRIKCLFNYPEVS